MISKRNSCIIASLIAVLVVTYNILLILDRYELKQLQIKHQQNQHEREQQLEQLEQREHQQEFALKEYEIDIERARASDTERYRAIPSDTERYKNSLISLMKS